MPYDIRNDAIDVYKPLGLTSEETKKSIETTKAMILKLADILSDKHPKWIEDSASDYLQIETRIEGD